MRSSLRLLNLEATPLQVSRTRYVCSVCRQEARPRPFVARQFLRNASDSSTPITERVRRKLWGTDNPPGLKDPYGGEGVFEKKFKRGQAARQEDQAVEATPAETQGATAETAAEEAVPEGSSSYEPATTWAGLQRIGHLGNWSDYPPSEADAYNSFFSNRRATKPEHFALAAHQAAVELCLMHSLDKPLTRVCDVVEHEKAVFNLIWNCKIQPSSQWNSALEYPDKETEEALVYIFQQIGAQDEPTQPEEAAAEDVESAETEEVEEFQAAGPSKKLAFFGYPNVKDKGYLSLSLADPATKFAFLKRFSQLTGHYFPDPTIESINTVQHAMNHATKEMAPKPKKLIDHLEANEQLQSLPNVKIFGKKQKPWHHDEELGRKKIIDAELRARGLIE